MAVPASTHPKPLRADARRNRERILEAALAAFAEHGAEAQIDDVASRAGVGVGTMYRHFPTKEALLDELVARQFARFAEIAEEALGIDDPWQGFCAMVLGTLESCEGDQGVQLAVSSQRPGQGEEHARATGLWASTSELIARAQEAGAMRRDFAIEHVPMLMCGLSSALHVPGWDWRAFADIALRGLRAEPGG